MAIIHVAIISASVWLTQSLAHREFLCGASYAARMAQPSLASAATVALCVAAVALLDVCLPGARYEGPKTEGGVVPSYTDNAAAHCLLVNVAFLLALPLLSESQATFAELASTLNVGALAFCAWLYYGGVRAFPPRPDSATTDDLVRDFFWGVDLYPRVCGFDVKRLLNCRVSMTFWMLHGLYLLRVSWETTSDRLALSVCALLQWAYLVKFFVWERGYMHSIDIIMDRCGFYETWGVLVFVPTVYTVHTRAIAACGAPPLPVAWAVGLGGLGAFSLACNYIADRERLLFRSGKLPGAAFVPTGSGEGLLHSGWWGLCRHPQYLSEATFAWCLALLSQPWSNGWQTSSYASILTIVLLHRTFRDERKCALKYGHAYQRYCSLVPYRVVPFVW